MNMRAGIIVDNEFINDIRVKREAAILKAEGYDVRVLCVGFGKHYDEPEGMNVTRIALSRRYKDAMFFFMNVLPVYEIMWAREISRFILKNNPAVIHVHDLYMSKAAHKGIKRSGRKIPMILDLHENYPFQVTTYNWTKGFLRNMLSRPASWKKKEFEYLGYADRIVVLSKEYRDSLMNEYPRLNEDRFIVFPNVPDINAPEYTAKTRVENPFKNDFPILLYYGVIAERRGIFETIDVFFELVKNNFEVNLLLIGPVDKKDSEYFTELASYKELKGKLIHIPWINSKEFPGYLEISDICLAPFRKNPQHESGIANKIYDYMLGGKPLVVSDCRPQKNLVEKYNCGLVFSDTTEFYNALITLLKDEQLRRSMGRNGQNAITSFYNIATFKDLLIKAYNQITSRA
ncbi:MAG TPA: glycosyltransferase family 4 protein [Bacteroidales bacterium]|nr:glycosyltransferase family 4 protein [Bacteroidales bacterium]